MSVIIDPEHWTFRGGNEAVKFGDPYTCIAQGQVQDDRTFYLYGAVGEWRTRDVRSVIESLRALAPLYRWKEIIWERYRGTSIHTARFLVPQMRES